jgi:hypothetical protein
MNDLWVWNTKEQKWSFLGGSKDGSLGSPRYVSGTDVKSWPGVTYGASIAAIPGTRLMLMRGGVGRSYSSSSSFPKKNLSHASLT